MIYIIIGISVLFIALGFLLTVDNAKYLLSGYNTMSKEEQKKVDIASYIPFFKKLHIALGLVCLVVGSLLSILISEKAATLFLTIFPMAAYIFFIQKSKVYYHGLRRNSNNLAQIILIAILIFVIIMMLTKGI